MFIVSFLLGIGFALFACKTTKGTFEVDNLGGKTTQDIVNRLWDYISPESGHNQEARDLFEEIKDKLDK